MLDPPGGFFLPYLLAGRDPLEEPTTVAFVGPRESNEQQRSTSTQQCLQEGAVPSRLFFSTTREYWIQLD